MPAKPTEAIMAVAAILLFSLSGCDVKSASDRTNISGTIESGPRRPGNDDAIGKPDPNPPGPVDPDFDDVSKDPDGTNPDDKNPNGTDPDDNTPPGTGTGSGTGTGTGSGTGTGTGTVQSPGNDTLDDDGVLSPKGIDKLEDLLGTEIAPDGEKILWVKCDESEEAAIGHVALTEPASANVRLFGEICSKKKTKLSVLPVVDFSCEMSSKSIDPVVNGGCGRFEDAALIAKELARKELGGAEINVGLVGFSGKDIKATLDIPLGSVSRFTSLISAKNLCSSDLFSSGSNYRAAFEAAYQTLKNVEGPKLVYFMTGSIPTRGGTSPIGDIDVGLEAAKVLRSLPGLTLEALVFRRDPVAYAELSSFLKHFTGDPARVRDGFNTIGLVNALRGVQEGGSVDLSAFQSEAYVEALSSRKSLTVDILKKRPDKDGYWIYGTAPFKLTGTAGRTVTNDATVIFHNGAGGLRYESTAEIWFTAK